ncbi:hypothetical protein QUF72_02030 [Desulfobacterales bacterium HSG2]|nr:hypothetical protein [Desulfobacterales bacterium HSG2]
MKDNNASGFKFKVDKDERPDSLFQTKKRGKTVKEDREEILSRRITLISLLILCLMGVIVFGAYLHIEKKFDKIHSSGFTEIQSRSLDLESKLSAFADRYEKLEASLIKKASRTDDILSKLEGATASLGDHLKRLEKSLNRINASKADKKELANAITRVDKTLSPIRKDLADLKASKDIGPEIDEKFTEELAKLYGEVDNAKKEFDKLQTDISDLSISKLQTDISELSSGKVSKESLDIALEEQEKNYKENLILINENLGYKEDKIKALQERLEKIEKRLNVKKKKYHKPAGTANSKPPAKSGTVEKPATEDPEPGKIVEQNIE